LSEAARSVERMLECKSIAQQGPIMLLDPVRHALVHVNEGFQVQGSTFRKKRATAAIMDCR